MRILKNLLVILIILFDAACADSKAQGSTKKNNKTKSAKVDKKIKSVKSEVNDEENNPPTTENPAEYKADNTQNTQKGKFVKSEVHNEENNPPTTENPAEYKADNTQNIPKGKSVKIEVNNEDHDPPKKIENTAGLKSDNTQNIPKRKSVKNEVNNEDYDPPKKIENTAGLKSDNTQNIPKRKSVKSEVNNEENNPPTTEKPAEYKADNTQNTQKGKSVKSEVNNEENNPPTTEKPAEYKADNTQNTQKGKSYSKDKLKINYNILNEDDNHEIFGLPREGFTCFFLTASQLVFSVKELRNYIKNIKFDKPFNKNSSSILQSLKKLLEDKTNEERKISIKAIMRNAAKVDKKIISGEQYDASIAFDAILRRINKEIYKYTKQKELDGHLLKKSTELKFNPTEKYCQAAIQHLFKKFNKSIIRDLFYGYILEKSQCNTCREFDLYFDPSYTATYHPYFLQYKNNIKIKKLTPNIQTYFDCLYSIPQQYTNNKCSSCTCDKKIKNNNTYTFTTRLLKTPKILQVDLSNCSYCTNIICPVNLLYSGAKYKLIAAAIHSGMNRSNGHCYSYVYNEKNKKWNCANDLHVYPIEEKDMKLNKATFLLYRKID